MTEDVKKYNEWPKITIVTPSYNQGEFIEETINSVIYQNYPNLEYFIVDGGSTDNTLEIIKKYEDKINWWVSEKDKGQSDAINKGFSRATGEVIGWLNSDDVYFPGALRKAGKAYNKHPHAAIYAGAVAIGALHDGPIRWCMIPCSPKIWIPRLGLMTIGQQGSFYNREIYNRTAGVDTNLYIRMDGDLWIRLMKEKSKAVIIPGMLGFIRWHDKTKSSTAEGKYLKESADFLASLKIPQWQYKMAKSIYRFFRLINGSYLRSWLVTQKYKNKKMRHIWAEYLDHEHRL